MHFVIIRMEAIFMGKIRFGIVGTGNIAHRFAQAVKNVEEAELVAVASRTAANAEKFGDEFNIPVRFDSYEKMAKSDVIDAAYIAVPHSEHIKCSILMMNNGKNVDYFKTAADIQNGVDYHTQVLMHYENGAVADISSAIMLRKPNEGYVYGTKGYARLERFYAPQKIEIHPNDGDTEIIEVPYAGNGFEEQIAHFCACINEGLTESPVNTRDNTLYITKQMDDIRKDIGLIYPQDK